MNKLCARPCQTLKTFLYCAFPAVLIPIADRHVDYYRNVAEQLKAEGLRVEIDERGERMNAKIRDANNQKIPYMLVVGDKEAENAQVALRLRGGENPGPMDLHAFLQKARADIAAGGVTQR